MANNKILQTRIQCKIDTEENWNKATTFIPLNGEIIIYDEDENNPTARVKIGDGVTSNIQNQLNDLNSSKVNYVDELIIDCGFSTVNIFN